MASLLPSRNYRAQLRRVVRLLSKEEVVRACDLLEKLVVDVPEFEAFVQSEAFGPFREYLTRKERSFRACIKDYEGKLNVLSFMLADLHRTPRRKQ